MYIEQTKDQTSSPQLNSQSSRPSPSLTKFHIHHLIFFEHLDRDPSTTSQKLVTILLYRNLARTRIDMAIIKNLECTVVVDGKDLQEYGTLEENENTVSTYIEAQEGLRYGIQYRFEHTDISSIVCDLYIDGDCVTSRYIKIDTILSKTGVWKGNGMYEERDLMFGKTIMGKCQFSSDTL